MSKKKPSVHHHKPSIHHPKAPTAPKVIYVEVVQPFHHMDMHRSWMQDNHPNVTGPNPGNPVLQ